jgi:hypothetical protein
MTAERLFFHGDDRSAPFLTENGQQPLIKDNDPSHLQPQEFYRAFVDVFDMSDPEQRTKYTDVVNTIAKGTSVLCREEVMQHNGKFIIYCRWMQRYYATASQVYEGARRNATTGQVSFRD